MYELKCSKNMEVFIREDLNVGVNETFSEKTIALKLKNTLSSQLHNIWKTNFNIFIIQSIHKFKNSKIA